MSRLPYPSDLTDAEWGMRGYDGAKKLNGRKRHLLVDVGGLVLRAVVQPANFAVRDGARAVLADLGTRFPAVQHVCVDMGCQEHLVSWAAETLGVTLTVVTRPRRWVRIPVDQDPPWMPSHMPVLPRRWIVECTFAWLGRYRPLSKDNEQLPATEEAWIYAAMTQRRAHRLDC